MSTMPCNVLTIKITIYIYMDYIHICIYMYICIYTHIFLHIYAFTVYIYIYMRLSLHVYMSISLYWALHQHFIKTMVRKLNFPFLTQLRKNHFHVSDPPGILLELFLRCRDIEICRLWGVRRYIEIWRYRKIQTCRCIET